MNNKLIFLLGFMGSGKSTLGKKLSKKLAVPFFDLDDEIEKKENSTVAQIFEEKGEEYFRLLEQENLKHLISTNSSGIIALGGGTPCFFDNMRLVNEAGTSIYIKYNAGVLCSRLMSAKTTRPLIKNKSEQELKVFIENSLSEREQFYLQSKFIIEGNNIKVEDLLSELSQNS